MRTPVSPEITPCLRGFETINRFWDPSRKCYIAKILPGEFYITRNDELVSTVLGSCVSACIRDTLLGLGGMNHFMLPESNAADVDDDTAMRYGSFAMEQLINEILKFGGHRDSLEIKLTGGGKILETQTSVTDIGTMNIHFVHQYLAQEGLQAIAEDLGGNKPRKVLYDPTSGSLKVKKLNSLHNDTLLSRERNYRDTLQNQPLEGDIELF